jgi:signal transduction histidine kinase
MNEAKLQQQLRRSRGADEYGEPALRPDRARNVGDVIRRAAGDESPVATRRRLRRPSRVLASVVALGLAGTTLAALAVRRVDQDRADRAVTQQTTIVAEVVAAEIRRYSTSLADLAAAVGAQSHLEASEFAAITASVDRERLPGASGVSFIVPATTAQIPAVQRYWRRSGVTGLTLSPVPVPVPAAGGLHLFAVLNRTIDGTAPAVGRDVAAATEAVEAMRAARDTRKIVTSRTYRLLKDAAVPAPQRQPAFVLAAPVFATSPSADDTGRFRGWLIMGLRAGDFLREAIGVVARDTVSVALFDPASAQSAPVARWDPGVEPDTGQPAGEVSVAVPQGEWRLSVQPTQRLLPNADRHLDAVAWLVGAVITLLLAALTSIVLSARDRALRRVDDATAALRDDIERREAVEQQLRRRETELVGFAGVVAHDLRSPLARISGYADFLREEAAPRLDPEHRDFLERLCAGARGMQSLIDDLLSYATADNPVLTAVTVDLHRLVESVVRERIGDTGDLSARVVFGELPVVAGDPTLLRQVFDNLIGNALKYTAPGHRPDIQVSSREDGNGWRVEVADRGIGIPDDQRDSVFTAFARAAGSEAYPGTGLGLAIVHRIVERHGGRVGVEANPGGGSRFWFTLPHRTATPADAPQASRAGAVTGFS